MFFTQNRKIVLASSSPRRKEFLERYGLKFKILTNNTDETVRKGELPLEFAQRMASDKARAVVKQCKEEEIVIAADTIVVFNGHILGKPGSGKNALKMLQKLNGQTHEVISSYMIYDCKSKEKIQKSAFSKVIFYQLPEDVLKAYAETKEPLDKAGGYSIQGMGTFLVRYIDGSYNNVVGLPVEMLIQDMLSNQFITAQS